MKILIGIDGAKSSEETLGAVINQFHSKDAEVLILHVLQPISVSAPPEMAHNFAPELEEQRKHAEEVLRDAKKKLVSAGFKADSVTAQGDVRQIIIDLAKEWHADLIMVGSHGADGIRRWFMRNVAEFLAQHAPCSFQVVRAPAHDMNR